MTTDPTFTLLVPTYNRPDLLAKLLRYLSLSDAGYAIHVLDSSRDEVAQGNRRLCAEAPLAITYRQYPADATQSAKWLDGLRRVETPFVSFCADDDLVFSNLICQCTAFLDANPDYVACHADYVNFPDPNQFYREYHGPSLDGETFAARLWQLLKSYEAMTYAVFRTEVYIRIFELNARHQFELMYQELNMGVLPLVYGKIKRLPGIYYARNGASGGADANRNKWHPLLYLMEDSEELFREFARYKEAIMACLAEAGAPFERRELNHLMNLIHCYYFIYSCNNKTIGEAVETRLEATGATVPPPEPRDPRADATYMNRAGVELQIYHNAF